MLETHESILKTLRNIEDAKKEWEQTMDCIEDIIMVIDKEGKIVRLNKALVNLTGADFKAFLGKPWKESLNNFGFIEYTIDDSGRLEYSYKDSKWYAFSAYPMEKLVKTGEPGTVAMLKDITARRLAEVIIEAEKQKFKTLSDYAPFGIAMIDRKGNYGYVNPKFVEIFGYDLSDLSTGGEWFRLVFPDPTKRRRAVEMWLELVRSLDTTKTPSKVFEITSKDGTCKSVNITVVVLYRDQREGEEYLVFCEDITERLKAEEAIRMSHIALEQKNKELKMAYNELKLAQSRILQQDKMASIGQLAAGIAHEINNPISFIMSNLNTLNRYMDNLSSFFNKINEALSNKDLNKDDHKEKVEPVLNSIRDLTKDLNIDYIIKDVLDIINESKEGAERVKKIVQDLKTFSHIDEAEYKMSDINKGLESTINIVWNEIKYKATMTKKYGEIPLTKCNLGQLNQVFMNILVNAAQAIESHGEITVRTWHEGGYIYISILDTGCGIPEDMLKRIYEPFFTTKEVGKGTGLGLSIAYDIVKKHNGEIDVKSEVGKGTEFTIKIPVVEG